MTLHRDQPLFYRPNQNRHRNLPPPPLPPCYQHQTMTICIRRRSMMPTAAMTTTDRVANRSVRLYRLSHSQRFDPFSFLVLYVVVLVPPIRLHTKSCRLGASTHHYSSHSPDPVLYSASIQHILASARNAIRAIPLCCAVRIAKLDKMLPLCAPADFVDPNRTIRSISIIYGATASGTTTTIHIPPVQIIHSSACWTLRRPRRTPTFRFNIRSLDCCAQTF